MYSDFVHGSEQLLLVRAARVAACLQLMNWQKLAFSTLYTGQRISLAHSCLLFILAMLSVQPCATPQLLCPRYLLVLKCATHAVLMCSSLYALLTRLIKLNGTDLA